MIIKLIAGVGLAAFAASGLAAQDGRYWAPRAASAAQHAEFPIGTPLRLTMRYGFSSRSAAPGDRVDFELAAPLVYRGQVVVPAGALAVGEVRSVEDNSALGKGGLLEVQVRYLQTPYGPVRLTGGATGAGKGQRVLAIGGALFVAWPMMFIQGRSGRLPANTAVTAQLLDDLRFTVDPAAARMAAAAPTAVAAR